jgi:hypothetical protein
MTNVSDTSSNRRDQIANFAEILLNAPARQIVFEAIYRGKKATKTIGEIAKATRYSAKRVATIAGPLAHGEKLFDQAREEHEGKITTVYKKIPFVARNKVEILGIAKNRCVLDRYHTKTNPKITTNIRVSKGQRVSIKVPFQIRSKFIRVVHGRVIPCTIVGGENEGRNSQPTRGDEESKGLGWRKQRYIHRPRYDRRQKNTRRFCLEGSSEERGAGTRQDGHKRRSNSTVIQLTCNGILRPV